MTTKKLIELSTAGGQHGLLVCRSCYERMFRPRPGQEPVPDLRDGRGEPYCQVYRGESPADCECMAPCHGS